jgi:hypothetical protein
MVASELGLQLSRDLETQEATYIHTYIQQIGVMCEINNNNNTYKQTNKLGVMCEINNNNNNCKNLRGPYLLPLA